MAPSRIFLQIVRDKSSLHLKDYTYIILGKTGPTGKTWLCNELNNHGYKAFEISELVNSRINYVNEDENVVIFHHDAKIVTIILNERWGNRNDNGKWTEEQHA